MKTINEQIDEILERFNFKKVIGYYNLVNWRVKDKILTEEELRQWAVPLLQLVANDEREIVWCSYHLVGLTAYKALGILHLEFFIEQRNGY